MDLNLLEFSLVVRALLLVPPRTRVETDEQHKQPHYEE